MKANGKWVLSIRTNDGEFVARYSEQGLCGLDFPTAPGAEARSPEPPREIPAQVREWRKLTAAALKRVLNGEMPGALPPLDLTSGTEFQRRVWELLCAIGPGQTSTYGEIAHRLGRPGAMRAVGGACGANPVPVLVPCHRVLAANRKIGGFSGGAAWKEKLLAREGVLLPTLSARGTKSGD